MTDIQSLLDGVIESEIRNVETLSPESDEKSKAIQNLAALHKLRIEEIKAQTEADEKMERRKMDSEKYKTELAASAREEEFQTRQARDQVIDRCVKTGVAIGELVLPLICYGIWMNKGFKFEENGSFTSTTFKNLLNRFRPTK